MKKQAIIAVASVAVGLAAQAQPANVTSIYITGSTAFRSQTVSAIESLFTGGAPTNIVTRGNLNEHSAQYAILEGNISGNPYWVYTDWSGSEAGLSALSGTPVTDTDFNGNPFPLPNSTPFFLTPSTEGTSANQPSATETNVVTPNLAMADTSKAVSFSKAANFTTFGTTASFVGVVPFTWVKCTNSNTGFAAWTHLTNMTHDQAEVELGGPQVAAFFTGIAADVNVNVFQMGRNEGSGTRVNCLADTGFGITKLVDQWAVNPKGASPGVFGGPFTPAGAVDTGIPGYNLLEVQNAGFDSGGTLSQDLSIDGCSAATDPISGNTGVITVGYLGISDATANSMSTNLWLTLNGVFESDDAIAQGQYSYWGMEHLYGAPGLSGAQLTYGNSLYTAIQTEITALNNGAGKHSAGVALSYMQCTKGSDTAFPTHN